MIVILVALSSAIHQFAIGNFVAPLQEVPVAIPLSGPIAEVLRSTPAVGAPYFLIIEADGCDDIGFSTQTAECEFNGRSGSFPELDENESMSE
jgi:hypothetical protein